MDSIALPTPVPEAGCPLSAGGREVAGRDRDRAARARDRAAGLLDVQASERDALSDRLTQVGRRTHPSSGREVIVRAERDRERATEDRACAAADRAVAAENREHAAADRLRAALDREAAVAEQLLRDVDDPPGVLGPRHGVAALRRELDRAHRIDSALTAVIVAVDARDDCDAPDGRDAAGTPAHHVVSAVLSKVRSYDLVVAIGYDTHVIAAGGLSIVDARARFDAVQRSLAQAGITIGVGYAQLAVHDTPSTLIDRAHADRLATPRRIPGSASEQLAARP